MRASGVLALSILLACGGPGVGAPEGRRGGDRAGGGDEVRTTRRGEAGARRGVRELPRDATFADLVTAARRLDDLRDQESDAGCLLRVGSDGYRLEADLAVAVRPLPPPADDLDARLARDGGPVRILTRFGAYGVAPAQMGLVAIGTTQPLTRGTGLALLLTDRGLYARRTDRAGGERDALSIEWVLERMTWDEFDLVAVSAESSTPLSALADLLGRLPASIAGRLTFATPLAEGTRLPEPSPASEQADRAELCEDGLPGLSDDAPDGDLAPDRIRAGLAPLRRGAELCVGTSRGAGAAGGRLAITVRIRPDGRVDAACVHEDAIGDPALRACLVRAARELVFDPPGGWLDFALPMTLAPGTAQRQRALCD
jgi:hypothetical protein